VDLHDELICPSGTHLDVKGEGEESPYAPQMTGPGEYGPGVVGLGNLGNTCYMNSMLQCINATTTLRDYALAPGKLKSEINLRNVLGTGGLVAEAYLRLAQAMWSDKAAVVRPEDFKKVFGRFNSEFNGYNQQDSMEMFQCLMVNLHEDLNRVKVKQTTEPIDDNGRPDAVVAKEAWQNFLKRNRSIIVDEFYGQDKSQLWCPDCMKEGKSRRKFDPRLEIQCQLPSVTTKLQKITLVHRRGPSGPARIVRYGLQVPKHNGTGADMAAALSKLSGVPDTSLVICEMYSKKVYKTYHTPDASSPVDNVYEHDLLMAYEVLPSVNTGEQVPESKTNSSSSDPYAYGSASYPATKPVLPNDAGGNNLLQLRVGKMIVDPYYNEQRCEFFGHPLVLSYPRGTKNADVRLLIEAELRALCKKDEEDVLPAGTELRVLGTDGEPQREQTSWYTSAPKHIEFPEDDEVADSVYGIAVIFPVDVLPIDQNLMDMLEDHPSYPTLGGAVRRVKPQLTLHQCLEATFRKEKLGQTETWYCPDCKNHVRAFKKMDIWSLADTMVIALKRFTQIQGAWSTRSEKNETAVSIPLELDMSTRVCGPQNNQPLFYDLYAVSHHYGGMGGGHYVAYAQHKGQWYNCDDHIISPRSAAEACDPKSAYALFYRLRAAGGAGGVAGTAGGAGAGAAGGGAAGGAVKSTNSTTTK